MYNGEQQSSWNAPVLKDIIQLIQEATDALPDYVCFRDFSGSLAYMPSKSRRSGSSKKHHHQGPNDSYATIHWSIVFLSHSMNTKRRRRSREYIGHAQQILVGRDDAEIAISFFEVMRCMKR